MAGENTLRWTETAWAERGAKAFWEDKGGEVLIRAWTDGLPICELENEFTKGITFIQIRYQKKNGSIRTKWLISKGPKKKHTLLGTCRWTLLPMGIQPSRCSLEPQNQQYGYQIQLESNIRGERSTYSARIETKWDGTIIRSQIDSEKAQGADLRDMIPEDFRYPKQVIARINRCLAKHFFADLWCGPSCAVWHRPDDRPATYMGIPGADGGRSLDGLQNLLQPPYGDAAAVLLSYTCFSLLKPWFSGYPTLNKKSAYLTVKKNLPKMFAINIWSNDLKSAEQMAEYCCGEFQRMGDGKFPIVDGVSMQKFPAKQTALSENVFEQRVLQPASILWVNRKPAKALKKEGKILDLQVPPGFDMAGYAFEPLDMMAAVVKGARDEDIKRQQQILIANRRSQKPIAEEVIKKLRKIAERYNFEFQDVDLDKERQEISKDAPEEALIEWLSSLKHAVTEEIRWEAKGENDLFLAETQQMLSACLRKMREIHRGNSARQNFLAPYYEEGLQELKGSLKAAKVEKAVAEKLAYLWASAKFSIAALPQEKQNWISRQIFRSLCAFARQHKDVWPAGGYLEKYIVDVLKEGACARIRGKRSDQEGIQLWYDPREKVFLLPAQRYFADLQRYITEPKVTQRIFEKKLAEEGAIKSVARQNQLRRTFEVRVQKNGPKVSVLRVQPTAFSKEFWESKEISKQLKEFNRDRTPLRG